jgi:aconitate hydratase
MTQVGQDSLGTRSTLTVGGKNVAYYSLKKAAEKFGDVSRLPFSMKVLLENLLRFEDGGFTVSADDVKALVDWQKNPSSSAEIQYRPARVLLRISPACPAWSTLPRCATRSPSWAATPARSTRWCPCTW